MQNLRWLYDSGSRPLNDIIRKIIEALRDIDSRLSVVEKGAPPSTSAAAFGVVVDQEPTLGIYAGAPTAYRGMVLSNTDSGIFLADASRDSLRPVGVADRDLRRGDNAFAALDGICSVVLESGCSPRGGDPAYLSATEPGRVVNARPSTGQRFLVGSFLDTVDNTGRAPVILRLSLSGARTL